MIRTLSQTERARRSTIITRAGEDEIDALGEYYGITRPASYPPRAWREVLKAVVYQPRGTFRVLFGALNALFSPWRDAVQITADIDATGSFTHASLTSTAYAHRWVTIGEGVYWVNDVDTATTTARLSRVSSAYFSGWDTALDDAVISFLPFYIVESRALVSVYLDVALLTVPPTYLQETAQARPAGQPYGGQLLNLLDLDPETLDYGDQVNGAFPLYLTGDEASGVLGDLLRQIIPAGVRYALLGTRWGGSIGYPPLSSLVTQGSV